MWHGRGSSQEGVDGAWSFRPFVFVLLSMATTSGLSFGKGCQQVRSCFPRSKIIPILPSLLILCLPLFFFPFSFFSPFLFFLSSLTSSFLSLFLSPFLSCNFPSFYFPLLFPFSFLFCFSSGKKRGAHATLPLVTSYFFKWLGFGISSTSLSKLPVSTISSHPSCLCWLLVEALLPF